jgi:hypothetical protein
MQAVRLQDGYLGEKGGVGDGAMQGHAAKMGGMEWAVNGELKGAYCTGKWGSLSGRFI